MPELNAKKKSRRKGPPPHDETAEIDDGEGPRNNPFPIVGIGCSAGGLEALEAFFKNVDPELNIAFVVITHLVPKRPSMMADILGQYTTMEVVEAVHGMLIEPNKVYVIPPGKYMSIFHRALQLSERPPSHEPPKPIDFFLRSLAEDQGENAIAIILSGNGSDGTHGLRMVQANLGIVLVQRPETAKYTSMPQSAIDTGLADHVLPPEDMPGYIANFVKQFREKLGKERKPEPDAKVILQNILALVRKTTGHDFSFYKKNTICRRIDRRMSVHQLHGLQEYERYLHANPAEINLLFKELLIQVTKFFRDPEAFEALKNTLGKTLFVNPNNENGIRAWIPGCSTGEEAYTIAIILKELMEEKNENIPVHIFGTDIDEEAIVVARTGEYPISVATDIGEGRVKRFFTKEDDHLRVRKDIREMVVFAPQNIVHDPPFVRLDIISCRNLLIYFEPELQKRVLDIFAYALKPLGTLFLGTSESVDGKVEEFATLDSKSKVFQRRDYVEQYSNVEMGAVPEDKLNLPSIEPLPAKSPNITTAAEHAIINHYSPPAVIIDSNDNIVYFHGRTGKYLEPAMGKASLYIQSMLRDEIRFQTMSAIRETRETGREVVKEAVQVASNGESRFMNIYTRPIPELKSIGGLMVVFQDVTIPQEILKKHHELEIAPNSNAQISKLEDELKYTKENLQSTIEELETSNEELKSTNEELQSTNEELQSIAEESETTKEELNSLNEELLSINSELETKNRDLLSLNADMKNLLNSVDVATIFLDSELRIKRFTPQISAIMNILPSDIGRPFSDISTNLLNGDITSDSRKVLEDLNTKVKEVRTVDGKWFNVKIIPYRTMESKIDGAVITFLDIDAQKKAQQKLVDLSQELKDSLTLTNAIIDSIKQPLLVLDRDLKVVMASRAFTDMFRVDRSGTEGRKIYELGNREWDIPQLRELLDKIIPLKNEINDFMVEHDFPIIGHRIMSLSAKKLDLKEPETEQIIITIDDVTEGRSR
jgi:two-component system CheB/CheR fusion protein